jgi:hypothetical protein
MIKSDYLIRQLAQLIQALIELIFRSEKLLPEEKIDLSKQACKLLELKEADLLILSGDQLIDLFSQQPLGLEKLEIAAYVLLLNQQKMKAQQLLFYVDQYSDCYSLNRKIILDKLIIAEAEKLG